MENKVIVYKDSECIKICIPTGELPLDEVIVKAIPKDVQYFLVDRSLLPKDRIFRNGWNLENGKVIEDLDLCKKLAKDIIRQKRKILLENLDAKYMIAIENNNVSDMDKIKSEKQTLRDKPIEADKFDSVESLKLWINSI